MPKVERCYLAQHAFLRLREVCGSIGLEFRPVDHLATEFSMEVLEEAIQTSAALNFVTLLSQKYGFRPLPRVIPFGEFQKLLSGVKSKEDKHLVSSCYRLNSNLEPQAFEFRPRAEVDISFYSRFIQHSCDCRLTDLKCHAFP